MQRYKNKNIYLKKNNYSRLQSPYRDKNSLKPALYNKSLIGIVTVENRK